MLGSQKRPFFEMKSTATRHASLALGFVISIIPVVTKIWVKMIQKYWQRPMKKSIMSVGAGELEASWTHLQTWGPSPDRESSVTYDGERTGWKSLVSLRRTVEPGVYLSETWSARLVMPAQPAQGECRHKTWVWRSFTQLSKCILTTEVYSSDQKWKKLVNDTYWAVPQLFETPQLFF